MFPVNRKFDDHCRQGGFTLIELLLVMAIITVLATLALVVIGEAQYDARRNATQARITQISKMLQQRLEDYQVRPVPLPSVTDYVDNTSQNFRLTARDLKRCILTDTINVEMPRSLLNIAYTMGVSGSPMNASYPSGQFVQWVGNQANVNQFVVEDLAMNPPATGTRFIQFAGGNPVNPLQNPGAYPEGPNFDSSNPDALDLFRLNFPNDYRAASSEYLYLILTTTQINGIQASTALGDSAFDDTDGDGFLEVVDSWGEPIAFQFLMVQPVSGAIVTRPDVNGVDVPRDLEPGNTMDDGAAVAPQQLRIYLESAGKGVEIITN